MDFYYCITQKLMTYALGRTLDYYDTDTVDHLVDQLEATGGRPSVLLQGIVNSAAFQQRRPRPTEEMADNTAVPTAPDRITH
jgi:NAD(P)-dependent dehydrogenase (short-subunit alcohol dehydrogenase family)